METSYKITFYYKDGRTVSVGADDLESAKDVVWEELGKDSECCANIVIAEFDSDTPHKQYVKLERYEKRGSTIMKVDQ